MYFYKFFGICVLLWGLSPLTSLAATLSVSPATGVYSTGATFSVSVSVNTSGKPINAADGTLSFNPRELSVVSVSRGSSIFSLWTSEPAFSNSAGTISFSGGSPSGYTGGSGNVMTITFRTLASGSPKVSLTGGSVLAADGRGTNVLTTMTGGTYTISAVENQPVAEVIVEYVPPANTPAVPVVKSTTHPDFEAWSQLKTAELNWSLPANVIAVRTLLDSSPTSIPTKVYDPAIKNISLSDLEEGISYFHIQFKNEDGWGRVAHVRLAVDTIAPKDFVLTQSDGFDSTSPSQTFVATFSDSKNSAPVTTYKIQLDGAEPQNINPEKDTTNFLLADLKPGHHTIVVEAIDAALNSSVASLSFSISAFDKPIFTSYPSDLNAGVIPVIKGTTRPNATVEVSLNTGSTEPHLYTTDSNEQGEFIFIPDSAFDSGVYTLTAVAIDQHGARSDQSDSVRIAVQQPGYLAIGTFLVNILSVFISLLALVVLTGLSFWYALIRFGRLRGRVRIEASEAVSMLQDEFAKLELTLSEEALALAANRKGGALTKGEQHLIEHMQTVVKTAKLRVGKEMADVSALVSRPNNRNK